MIVLVNRMFFFSSHVRKFATNSSEIKPYATILHISHKKKLFRISKGLVVEKIFTRQNYCLLVVFLFIYFYFLTGTARICKSVETWSCSLDTPVDLYYFICIKPLAKTPFISYEWANCWFHWSKRSKQLMLQVKLNRSGHLSSSREHDRASQPEQRQEVDVEFQGRTPRICRQGIFFFLVPSSTPNLLYSSSVLFLLLGMGQNHRIF